MGPNGTQNYELFPQIGSVLSDICLIRSMTTDGYASGGCCDSNDKPRSHDTSRIAWAHLMARVGEEFPPERPWVRRRYQAQSKRPAGVGSLRTGGLQAEEGQDGFARVKSAPHASWRAARHSTRLARPGPARRLGAFVGVHDDRGAIQALADLACIRNSSTSGEGGILSGLFVTVSDFLRFRTQCPCPSTTCDRWLALDRSGQIWQKSGPISTVSAKFPGGLLERVALSARRFRGARGPAVVPPSAAKGGAT